VYTTGYTIDPAADYTPVGIEGRATDAPGFAAREGAKADDPQITQRTQIRSQKSAICLSGFESVSSV
jgi:hypothetical protein